MVSYKSLCGGNICKHASLPLYIITPSGLLGLNHNTVICEGNIFYTIEHSCSSTKHCNGRRAYHKQ